MKITEKEINNAYSWLMGHTSELSNEVLLFMKEASLEKLQSKSQQSRFLNSFKWSKWFDVETVENSYGKMYLIQLKINKNNKKRFKKIYIGEMSRSDCRQFQDVMKSKFIQIRD